MANEGRPDTNSSQFFFTLDKAEELNGKNTMFGRVAGDTIYNLAKIGESEVDPATERLLYPVKIERVEILVNPFEDMKKRTRVATKPQVKAPTEKDKKKKRKGGKQLLSFGDEEGDEEMPTLKKAKFDTRIVMEDEAEAETTLPRREKSSKKKQPKRDAPNASLTVEADDDKKELASTLDTSKAQARTGKPKRPTQYDKEAHESSPEPEPEPAKKTALEIANEEIAALKASMRRTVHSQQPVESKKKSAFESMIPETSMRARKRRPGGNNTTGTEDQATLRMLKAFQSRLEKAPPSKDTTIEAPVASENVEESSKQAPEEEAELCDLHFIANCQSCTSWDKQDKDESDDEGWMSHSLSFAADRLGKDLSNRRKAEEELVVIDPREKARTLKEEKQAQRDARAGGSGRAWDQGRDQAKNAQMARVASLAGRGAK